MKKLFTLIVALLFTSLYACASEHIVKVEPTPLFPKQQNGEELKQIVRVTINNSEAEALASLEVKIGNDAPFTVDLGKVATGESTVEILMPTVEKTQNVNFTLKVGDKVSTKKMMWQPQKQWKIYYCAVSHQDLGFETYYQNIRRGVREGGLDMALEYCRNTDSWDEESKFRWNVETSEPLIRWVSKRSKEEVAELVQRIKEGRIELGAIHNTISSQMAGYEVFARSFYTPNRYVADMLDLDPAKVAIINDVTGITRSWPLFSKEADIPYLMHGSNSPNCLQDLYELPVFRWISPDNDGSILSRADSYYSRNKLAKWDAASMEHLIKINNTPQWAYDCILAYDSHDFALPTLDNATNIREWNQKYEYPKVICSVLSSFFDDVESQSHKTNIVESDKDAPDSWDDQDATDAELLSLARRVTSELPTAEKFASIAMSLDGGYPQVDLFQAYNGMIMYHEHTNSAIHGGNHQYYETEVETHRSLVEEADVYTKSVKNNAIKQISSNIKVENNSIVVYNPLTWMRNDIVTLTSKELPLSNTSFDIIDSDSGKEVTVQKLQNGEYVFFAENIPSMGYKSFYIKKRGGKMESSSISTDDAISNKFYNVTLSRDKNIISGIYDKELSADIIDKDSPYSLGEYIYYDHYRGEYLGAEFTDIKFYKGDVVNEIHIKQKNYLAKDLELVVYVYNELKKISFSLSLEKLSNEENLVGSWERKFLEAMFCAIPIDVPKYELNHELAGAVTQPGNPNMQLESAEAAYFAIQHFADASNKEMGVTLSTIDAALVEYGHPRPGFWTSTGRKYKDPVVKPENSNMFLYLMNNFFQTNVRVDQPGNKRFDFSIRSHSGDWKDGEAYKFAWESANPLFAEGIESNANGKLPKDNSFLSVDKDNVVCSTIKMAENNGDGYILRFFELKGKESSVKVKANFIGEVDAAYETNLIEDNKSELKINSNNEIEFTINGHGIKTIRINRKAKGEAAITNATAQAVSDAEVSLNWSCDNNNISHYVIYASREPECEVSTRNFIGNTTQKSYVDKPQLSYAGWLSRDLSPNTKYYYRVCAIDKYNNQIAQSKVIEGKTLSSNQKNATPNKVVGVKAIHISPLSPDNYVNIIFYTNIEKDVDLYEVYRSTNANFKPSKSSLVGTVIPSKETLNYKGTYSNSELEIQMFQDKSAAVNTKYFYKVCAVDKAGQKGEYSDNASVTMREVPIFISAKGVANEEFSTFVGSLEIEIKSSVKNAEIFYTIDGSEPSRESNRYKGKFIVNKDAFVKVALYKRGSSKALNTKMNYFTADKAISQSSYDLIWSATAAIDGNLDSEWVSKQYSTGTKENPKETWIAITLPKEIKVKGIQVVGDSREMMPKQEYFEVLGRKGGVVSPINGTLVSREKKNVVDCIFNDIHSIDGIKILFPANKLPKIDNAGEDGIVRISEIYVILENGTRSLISDILKRN